MMGMTRNRRDTRIFRWVAHSCCHTFRAEASIFLIASQLSGQVEATPRPDSKAVTSLNETADNSTESSTKGIQVSHKDEVFLRAVATEYERGAGPLSGANATHPVPPSKDLPAFRSPSSSDSRAIRINASTVHDPAPTMVSLSCGFESSFSNVTV